MFLKMYHNSMTILPTLIIHLRRLLSHNVNIYSYYNINVFFKVWSFSGSDDVTSYSVSGENSLEVIVQEPSVYYPHTQQAALMLMAQIMGKLAAEQS